MHIIWVALLYREYKRHKKNALLHYIFSRVKVIRIIYAKKKMRFGNRNQYYTCASLRSKGHLQITYCLVCERGLKKFSPARNPKSDLLLEPYRLCFYRAGKKSHKKRRVMLVRGTKFSKGRFFFTRVRTLYT